KEIFLLIWGSTASASVECSRRTDASAPPAESLPAPKNFFAKTSFTQRLPLNGPESNFAAFSGKGHEAIFEFHASPLPGGVRHGGVSLWPCSSRRQVTRHGRQPGGANASVGGSSALSGSFQ